MSFVYQRSILASTISFSLSIMWTASHPVILEFFVIVMFLLWFWNYFKIGVWSA